MMIEIIYIISYLGTGLIGINDVGVAGVIVGVGLIGMCDGGTGCL
ncbi:putative membrane protein [Acanthamoeba polyphaga mimivirus]|uniref:Putative membrane protein n=1 Tax=Acanthamoeba polyphaga mimivirus TaxID=212035 RepID=A0A0G2YDG5_MIMIV|nr:putative membrane protein [Acanthamoeba castellanii mamavirus]AKI81156.1 putative membrane protein [Acanthamoeba polyphaga mimivirus]